MERHAERGARILANSSSDVVRLAAEIAVSHHERWDGTGYPNGLAGPAIPGRPHRRRGGRVRRPDERPALQSAWTLEAAHAFLLRESGAHFDPAVCRGLPVPLGRGVADLVGQARAGRREVGAVSDGAGAPWSRKILDRARTGTCAPD